MHPHDEHFRQFIRDLEVTIDRYDGDNDLKAQKGMVERLVGLEKEFRKTLIRHRWGKHVYKDFIHHIVDIRRNILIARPYFRERNEVFQGEIAEAFRSRSYRSLYRYSINWNFVQFVVQSRKWARGSRIMHLAQEIEKARYELCERNMPLAISEAKLFYGKTPPSQLAYMDCIQTAADGLMSAIDKFVLPYTSVFRAVIIGRIRGKLIEAYSRTSLHFYPRDKSILYRARKHLSRMRENPHIDYDELCRALNAESPETPVTPGQLINLLDASSVVSASSLPVTDEESADRSIESYGHGSEKRPDLMLEASNEKRPDLMLEEAEANRAVGNAIKKLTIWEQKILTLKGVEL